MAAQEPYRGFPYTTSMATEAPSLSREEVAQQSKWRDLPVRRIGEQMQQTTPRGRIAPPPPRPAVPAARDQDESTVGVFVTEPVICYEEDLPQRDPGPSPSVAPKRPSSLDIRRDSDGPPVLYIDIPESDSSNVSQRIVQNSEPEFVQDTIFYDPFKDTMVSSPNGPADVEAQRYPGSTPGGSSGSGYGPSSSAYGSGMHGGYRPSHPGHVPSSSSSYGSQHHESHASTPSASGSAGHGDHRPYIRPMPSQNAFTPGSSTGNASSPGMPPMLSKESHVYGRQPTQDDGFPLSPIPVSDFPAPPPSYDQIHSTQPVRQPTESRTEVTLTNPTVVITQDHRKMFPCPYCGTTVRALRVREVGYLTHVIAWLPMFICLFPATIGIYYTDCAKYQNHYCPNCNQKIAYEPPVLCHGDPRLVSIG